MQKKHEIIKIKWGEKASFCSSHQLCVVFGPLSLFVYSTRKSVCALYCVFTVYVCTLACGVVVLTFTSAGCRFIRTLHCGCRFIFVLLIYISIRTSTYGISCLFVCFLIFHFFHTIFFNAFIYYILISAVHSAIKMKSSR